MRFRTAGNAGWFFTPSILLAVVSLMGQAAMADDARNVRLDPWRIERDILRYNAVATDNILEILGIRPGMTILDIGAGTGRFALEFIRRLNGTGKVFATDTNEECVSHMKQEAERRGIRNLFPALVLDDGLDPFYGTQRYDLVTAFHVSLAFEEMDDYFRELRGYMNEGGRLALILYKIPAPFSPDDFTGDFKGLTRQLAGEPEGDPFHGILRDTTRRRILEHSRGEPFGSLKERVAEDFNETMSDPRFAARFYKGSGFREELRFLPEERRYADWALPAFPDNAARRLSTIAGKRKVGGSSASRGRSVKTASKLLILQRYRKYLRPEGQFLSGFTPRVRAVFERAGYRVIGEYPDLIPFEDLIILSAR